MPYCELLTDQRMKTMNRAPTITICGKVKQLIENLKPWLSICPRHTSEEGTIRRLLYFPHISDSS